MSCQTSHGRATIRQLCQAFGVSTLAYYAARRPPTSPRPSRRQPATVRGWASVAEREPLIRQCVDEPSVWGVRKVWAWVRRQGPRVSRKRVWALMQPGAWCCRHRPCATRRRAVAAWPCPSPTGVGART